MKSPLRWVGGKSKLSTKIIDLFPDNFHKMGYVEVFGGAAWMLCAKPASRWEVLNDFDGELMNFFRVAKYSPNDLIESFEFDLISREEFNALKADYKERCQMSNAGHYRVKMFDGIDYENVQRAHDFFYLNQTCFGGDMKNPVFGAAKEKSRMKLGKVKEEILDLHQRLIDVTVECLDFEDIIKKYDSENTLFYLDPPYVDTKGYTTPFSMDDHKRLANALINIEGWAVLTINDCPAARELYKDFNLMDHEVYYSQCKTQNGREKFNELIVLNYDIIGD